MSLPIILLCGNAGVGKDSVANILRDRCGAAVVAQADPMKRIVGPMFGFSEETLWGPSAKREELVPKWPWSLDTALAHLFAELRAMEWDGDWGKARVAFTSWFTGAIPETNFVTARKVLQTFGTEFGRETLGREVWAQHARDVALKLLCGGHHYTRLTGLSAAKTPPAPMVAITDGRFPNEILGVKAVGGLAVLVRRPTDAMPAGHASEDLLKTIPDHFYDAIINNIGDLRDLERMTQYMVTDLIETRYYASSGHFTDGPWEAVA